jgi:hypothetical protein
MPGVEFGPVRAASQPILSGGALDCDQAGGETRITAQQATSAAITNPILIFAMGTPPSEDR